MEYEDMTGEEEFKMSTPYSDRAAWAQILMGQLLCGESSLTGPPGLLEQMKNLLSSSTEQEMMSRLLTHSILDEKTKDGSGAAFTSPAIRS